jgi:hypothetical protein
MGAWLGYIVLAVVFGVVFGVTFSIGRTYVQKERKDKK